MSKILVVEDDQDLLKTLQQCLELANFTVEVCSSGQEALHRLKVYSYDLVLMDWQLPDLTGIEILQKMRANRSHTPVLMMTARKETEEKATAFDSGVDDYLTKPFNLKELILRVRAILRRGPLTSTDDVLKMCELRIDTRSHRVYYGSEEIRLIPKEYAILELLMRNLGQIFSQEQIIARGWHSDEETSASVVRGHIKNLRKKLDVYGVGHFIATVHGFGYKIEEAPDSAEPRQAAISGAGDPGDA